MRAFFYKMMRETTAVGRAAGAEFPSDFSTDWMSAPPERRKHFQALTIVRELRTLQPPEPLQHLDLRHHAVLEAHD